VEIELAQAPEQKEEQNNNEEEDNTEHLGERVPRASLPAFMKGVLKNR